MADWPDSGQANPGLAKENRTLQPESTAKGAALLVRTVFQNVEHGARGGRWGSLAARVTGALGDGPPDLVLLSECEHWGDGDPTMLARAAGDLGMAALPVPYSRTGLHVAILYRQETMGKHTGVNDDFTDYLTHGVLTACQRSVARHP
jgi:hypothetical protein